MQSVTKNRLIIGLGTTALLLLALVFSVYGPSTAPADLPAAHPAPGASNIPSAPVAIIEDHDRAPSGSRGITVRVEDSIGRPLAGALVTTEGSPEQTTDSTGELRLQHPVTMVGARSPGYAPSLRAVSASEHTAGLMVLRLAPEAILVGSVRDCFDQPVPAAEVEVSLGSPGGSTGADVGLAIGRTAMAYRRVTRTDDNGGFSIAGLAQGDHRVSWRAPGCVAVHQDASGARHTWRTISIQQGRRHEQDLAMGILLVGAIDVVHAHGLTADLLRWMLGIGLELPPHAEPMSGLFPELLEEVEREIHGIAHLGHRHSIVAVAIGHDPAAAPEWKARFGVTFRAEAPVEGSLLLSRLRAWRDNPDASTVRVTVGATPVPTGKARIHTPYEVDIAGRSPAVFGVMPLISKNLQKQPETFVVELPVGEYLVAPSRWGLLANRKRQQFFTVIQDGLADVAVADTGIARLVVHAIDDASRPLRVYNLKIGDGRRGVMIAGRQEYGAVVQFMELGTTCHLQLWDEHFARKSETKVLLDKPVVEVRVTLGP